MYDFFFGGKIKEEFQKILNDATLIYNELLNELHLSTNICWKYDLNTRGSYTPFDVNMQDLEISLTTASAYIEQLDKIHTKMLGFYNKNANHLKKFSDKFTEFCAWFTHIMFIITNNSNMLTNICDYKNIPALKLIARHYQLMSRQLSVIKKKYATQDVCSI